MLDRRHASAVSAETRSLTRRRIARHLHLISRIFLSRIDAFDSTLDRSIDRSMRSSMRSSFIDAFIDAFIDGIRSMASDRSKANDPFDPSISPSIGIHSRLETWTLVMGHDSSNTPDDLRGGLHPPVVTR